MKRFIHPLAAALAGLFRSSGRAPSTHWAKARPEGKPTHGSKAMRSYRSQYTHVMTAMVTDKNLARIANRKSRKQAA